MSPEAQVSEKCLDEYVEQVPTADVGANTFNGKPDIAMNDMDSSEYQRRERRLVRKLDATIMPFAIFLYLSAYLDRGNLANARLQGLETTVLKGDDSNYSIALSCFFITYITCSIPGTLLSKRFIPSYPIAAGALIWSIAATCQAATVNPSGLYVCRLFVGIGEAMFGQSMSFHLSIWYTNKDLARRVGLFISAGALAGAFGGLISFGVSSIKDAPFAQWRILFLIEGCPSVLLAIATVFFMPGRPETSRLLNEQERALCLRRLGREDLSAAFEGIEWPGVRRSLSDWKTYAIAMISSCMNLGLGSVGGFLPTIIKGFGYTNAKAQLFTVPPYAVSLVVMLLFATFSDRTQARGIPIMSVFLIGLTGWAILLAIPASGHPTHSEYSARYFGCILVVIAGYTNIPMITSWQAANAATESQRATSLAMLNTLGQCFSVLAAFSFPSNEGPQYRKGCSLNIAFQLVGMCIAAFMTTYYRIQNRKKDRLRGGRNIPVTATVDELKEKFDLAPGFRYVT